MADHVHDQGEPIVLPIFGVVAEFERPEEVLAAAKETRKAGYSHIDAYTPFPIHGMSEAIGFKDPRVQWTIFLAGLAGGVFGFLFMCWVSAVDYPHNVGGRPLISWPSFIPVTFECTVLMASFAAFFGMLAYNKLPIAHHPIFNARGFERASQDRFILCIESTDPQFDLSEARRFLEGLPDVKGVSEVVDDSHL